MKCEWHTDCGEEVMAVIGLPGPGAMLVCREGFNEWQADSYARLASTRQDEPASGESGPLSPVAPAGVEAVPGDD